MDVPLRKVTARVDLKAVARPQPRSRPASPSKPSPASALSPPSFRPKAKVSPGTTVRKPSSSSSLNNAPHSRPGSPFKSPRAPTNEPGPSSSPKARFVARPTSRSGPAHANPASLEPRQRALTAASARLKLPHVEDRPRSGSVIALHHALSIPDLTTSSSSRPPPPAEPLDSGRTNTPPLLAPIKIKSKVTGLAKSTPASAVDSASRPLSPPYATTRPIHTRARAPSISSSFAVNDPSPPPFTFYPITTASPAANPHRYVPRRALSPARSYPSPPLSGEPHLAKRSPLVSKVDPASIPLPPHSPPISALSISSRSSASKTSASPNNDQRADNQRIPSHVKHRSVERTNQPSPLSPYVDIIAQAKRDRSRSREGSPRDLVRRDDSDGESDGSERQLRVEAKTNRKIADLEITNRSLLAINASLETTKNRQAREIRDLRRKLRESRLILPPRTYKAVEPAFEDEDEEEGEDSDVEEREDETFQRVRDLINTLIESGKNALDTRPEDFRATMATKVLNADELRSWRDSGQRTSMGNSDTDKQDADDQTINGHVAPALVTKPAESASLVQSDRELAADSQGSSALPPITITRSL